MGRSSAHGNRACPWAVARLLWKLAADGRAGRASALDVRVQSSDRALLQIAVFGYWLAHPLPAEFCADTRGVVYPAGCGGITDLPAGERDSHRGQDADSRRAAYQWPG